MRAAAYIATVVCSIASACVAIALAPSRAVAARAPRIEAPASEAAGPIVAPAGPRPIAPWAVALAPLRFLNTHTGSTAVVKLYADDGSIDEEAATSLDRLLAPPGDATDDGVRPMDRRLYQLVVKVAASFHATDVSVVSSFRDSTRKGSRHKTGEALDFVLVGVLPGTLAQRLRGYARAGVGIYTHPRTRFVHLDVRDASYHWVDASPPGHTWKESRITSWTAINRDAAYRPEQDLPL